LRFANFILCIFSNVEASVFEDVFLTARGFAATGRSGPELAAVLLPSTAEVFRSVASDDALF
jgi:hypothetical protein